MFKEKRVERFVYVRWGITFNICSKAIFYLDRNESIKMCSLEIFFMYTDENLYLT